MRVAVLMLAHKNKKQIERLISVLTHPVVDIYIHLDKKSTLSPSDFDGCNVRFTEKRFDIVPFDFSMVDAEMELIRTALAYDQYGYYILLSGQCYPLRHINDIVRYLKNNYPKPFIEVISPQKVTKFKRIFRYPHILKKFRTDSENFLRKHLSPKSIYPYKYIPEGIVFAATLVKSFFVKCPQKRLKAMGIDSYFGPQWWILPDVVINEMLSFYNDRTYCSCINDCFSCDETFFQTAIMVYADRFEIKINERGYYPNKKWFTIFSHGHPILLTKEYFDQLISSKMLFARKFDMDIDSKILDMLDEHNLRLFGKEI